MFRIRLFPSAVSCTAATGRMLAASATSSITLCARQFRRVVAAGLLLATLTPFAPMGHAHAEDAAHEVNDVPAVEAEVASGAVGAAAVHGCAPYISSSSSMRPDRGVLTFSMCVSIPFPGTWGLGTCLLCTCWYEMDDGRSVNLNEVDCGTIVIITNPDPGDDCSLRKC